MLTRLQVDIAQLIAGLPEAEGFALAGGGAMIVRGAVDRRTRDLDYFGRSEAAVERLAPVLRRALSRAGIEVASVLDQPGFVRLRASRASEECTVDLGHDVRLWPVEQSALGPVIAEEELAADKTLALFGRAEARDLVDMWMLAQRHGEDQLLVWAAAKDLGFSLKRLAEALDVACGRRRDEFDVDDATLTVTLGWARRWAERLRAE